MTADYFCALRLTAILFVLLTGAAGCAGETHKASTPDAEIISPVIKSVVPGKASVGATITVYGQNFGTIQGNSRLYIDGVEATDVMTWGDGEIKVQIPPGAGTGTVTVTVDGIDGVPGFLIVPRNIRYPITVARTGSGAGSSWLLARIQSAG